MPIFPVTIKVTQYELKEGDHLILLIMRHGIAEEQPHLLNDGDAGRRLTQTGRRPVEEMAGLLKALH